MDKKPVKTMAVAEFTRDMVDTLNAYFATYEQDGVVAVEVSSHGLWLPNPQTGGRQFLGLARFPAQHPAMVSPQTRH